jgi:hypothetical protein
MPKRKPTGVKPMSETPELDKLISLVESGLQNLNAVQNHVAFCADALMYQHKDDPYTRGALGGVMPSE